MTGTNMRVLMVTRETAPDKRYGLGRSLTPIVEALQARGIDTRYYCQDDLTPTQLQWRDALWQRMSTWRGLRGRADRLALARAWIERLQVGTAAGRIAIAEGYTHVHAHDPWLAAGVSHAFGKQANSVRWGVTEHGFGSYSVATQLDGLDQGPLMQWLLRRIEKKVLARADWVIAPTKACLTELARELRVGGIPTHWHEVPHAKPAIAPRDDASRLASRDRLNWAPDELVVVSVGRLVPLKCFDRLIAACAKASVAHIRLAILGGGDPAELQAVAAQNGLAGRVEFAFVDDVTPYLHGADIYVSASSTESFGLANLEALCAGLPSICSPVGGVPEVVGDGAWLVPNDIASLAKAIASLARANRKAAHRCP
ncbi:glycosyltransferase family 4 protein [Caenimonas koreensis]|uniref:glycosyltransferase family 4 protein n=1 Tax=Caenimonas koreensis TaxID=367474 RepID=UPI003784D5B2